MKFGHYLTSSDLQFGYKRKHSPSHAVDVMKKSVNHFVKNGSRVFVTFMDCQKGFDKISHYGIFLKLVERRVPLCFLLILMYWYLNLRSACRWGQTISYRFDVVSGVRQGGILSPFLFCVYVDDLISLLKNSHVGCYLLDEFVGSLFYADDLALLCPTREAMQLMLDLTINFGTRFGLSFSFKKTKTLIFGKSNGLGHTAPLTIYDQPIEIVEQWRYLGFHVKSGVYFGFSAQPDLSTFRRAANCLLNTCYKPSEEVMMKLLFTNCVPILAYGSQTKEYSASDSREVSVALNDCVRKIFGFNRWTSIRSLREQMGYRAIEEIFAFQKRKFEHNLKTIPNAIVKSLADFNPFL